MISEAGPVSYLGQEVRRTVPLTGPVRLKTKEAVNVPVPSIREIRAMERCQAAEERDRSGD